MPPSLPSTFVFDLETIPDLVALRRLQHVNDDVSDEAVLESADLNSQSLKPAFQQIVAIAGAWIAPNGALRRLTALGDLSWSEAELVQEMFRIIVEGHPRLAGWNTGGFDLPVLVYRAMVHHIATPGFYQIGEPYHGYRKRFDEEGHIDLMDILSFYGASTRLKLDEMAAVLGVPGKLGTDGSQVFSLYQEQRIADIRTYCETDVLTTALVWARYAEHRGWWDATQCTTFEQSVLAWLEVQTDPVWNAFRAGWQPNTTVAGHSHWVEDTAESVSHHF
ncbi:MAG: 3'-5' exonuclease [Firmicutes bacterium]|nr:3'-5' exonuclease [Bacillota bacterium]